MRDVHRCVLRLATRPDSTVLLQVFMTRSGVRNAVMQTAWPAMLLAGSSFNSLRPLSLSLAQVGSVTHSVNTDQRRIPLYTTSYSGKKYHFDLPGDPGIIVPGMWWIFAIDPNGVPSVGSQIQVSSNLPPSPGSEVRLVESSMLMCIRAVFSDCWVASNACTHTRPCIRAGTGQPC